MSKLIYLLIKFFNILSHFACYLNECLIVLPRCKPASLLIHWYFCFAHCTHQKAACAPFSICHHAFGRYCPMLLLQLIKEMQARKELFPLKDKGQLLSQGHYPSTQFSDLEFQLRSQLCRRLSNLIPWLRIFLDQ